MSYLDLTHSLADAFTALADEAQGLNDRRIVLEHKLRFAHEQVSLILSVLSLTSFLSLHEPLFCLRLRLRLRPWSR